MHVNSLSATALLGSSVGHKLERSDVIAPSKTERTQATEQSHRARGHHHRQHSRALGVFHQELKLALSARFRSVFFASQPNYSEAKGAATPDDVAAEALVAAKQVVNDAPVSASRALITFRQKVEEAASITRETVGADDGLVDVDGAVGRVNEGLDDLEGEAAKNVESSTSILAVDSRTRERSSIRIRTQEGDIVKFHLKRAENLSATDTAFSTNGTSGSTTQVEISSRSRMVLRVDGDLNEAELAAIQNVFTRAESIADEFFNGDLSAAFDLAAGFEYDTDQLARVRMGFRSRQVTNISYSEIRTRQLDPIIAPERIERPDPGRHDVKIDAGPVLADRPVDAARSPETVALAPEEAPPVEASVVADQPAAPAPSDNAIAQFFDLLSSFMRSVGEGFESNTAIDSANVKYHFSSSFKLEILKSVFQVVAPDESADSASNAVLLVDRIAGSNDSGQEAKDA